MPASKTLLGLINRGVTTLLGGLEGHTYMGNLRQLSLFQCASVAVIGCAKPTSDLAYT